MTSPTNADTNQNYMITASGKRFYFADPKPEMVDIGDIAHALSVVPRFAGHTTPFYSVAQHCVEVSALVEQKAKEHQLNGYLPENGYLKYNKSMVALIALAALLHDGHEAYVGDISTPLKALIPGFKEIEAKAEKAVRDRFGLIFSDGFHTKDRVAKWIKNADLVMLATERRDLMPKTDDVWSVLKGVEPREAEVAVCSKIRAWQVFHNTFDRLWTESSEARKLCMPLVEKPPPLMHIGTPNGTSPYAEVKATDQSAEGAAGGSP